MQLADLVVEGVRLEGSAEIAVESLTADSRAVVPGSLFAALPGSRADGHDFVAAAAAAGAVAVLGDSRLEAMELPATRLMADDPRRTFAHMAGRFFARQPEHAVAVTGTSGKTSTASFTVQLWRGAGLSAASLGTLGVDAAGFAAGPSLTTPEPVALHRTLRELADAGIDHLVMEASSHGLDQRRVDGVRFRAGAFLNLSRDHLDYHGSEAAYLAAKARLFEAVLPEGGRAVLNADVPEFARLQAIAQRRGLEILDFGRTAERFRLVGQVPFEGGQEIAVELDGVLCEFAVPLVGAFQASNLLAALALAEAAGVERAALLAVVPHLEGPRGRMERVATTSAGAAVYVDYSHKPAALAVALEALRRHTSGRLVVIFGCGGDRDRGKRPEMGAIAARLADRVIVTDDNPRSEDPPAIRREILAAAPRAVEIGDRAMAIAEGLAELGAGDVLLVAGKGHETGQIVGDEVHPFDDAQVVRRVLDGMGAAS